MYKTPIKSFVKGHFVRRAGPLLLLLAVGGAPRAVLADVSNPTDQEKAAARLLGTEGVQLAMSGDCRGATEKLTRAEALVHAPTTAVPLAQCQIQLGKIIAGTEILNRVLNETLPPGAPPPWIEAKQRAQALLDASAPRIAKLRIHVDRPPGSPEGGLQVTVDGEPLPPVLFDNDRPTDPGTHHVVANQETLTTAETDVSLTDGQSQTITLRLEALTGGPHVTTPEQPPAVPGGPVPPAPASAGGPAAPSRNRGPAYVALSVGGAGLIVGAVFGGLALATKSTLDSACPGGKQFCPQSSEPDINALHTNAILSTVGCAVGGAAAATGVILWLVAGSSGPKTARAGLRPWLGLGSAGFAGNFR